LCQVVFDLTDRVEKLDFGRRRAHLAVARYRSLTINLGAI
jgi:hypothetical protein